MAVTYTLESCKQIRLELITAPTGQTIARAAALLDVTPTDVVSLVTPGQEAVSTFVGEKYDAQTTVLPPMRSNGSRHISDKPIDVMLVSKMPNNSETAQMLAHTGGAGLVWKRYLNEKGVNYSDWVITYALPFTVPKHILGNGQLPKKLVEDGLSFLAAAMLMHKPKIIVAMGADALYSVLAVYDKKTAGAVKFSNARGSALLLGDGTYVVCCHSSHALLRQPELQPELESDLDVLIDLVTSSAKPPVLTASYDECDTFEKLEASLAAHVGTSGDVKLAVDVEWGPNEQIRTIQFAASSKHAVIAVLARVNMVPTELGLDTNRLVDLLKKYVVRDGVAVEGHNVRGDIKVLRKRLGIDLMPNFLRGGFDTMLAYHLLPGNETLSKQLEVALSRTLGVHRYDLPLRLWLKSNKLGKKSIKKLGYSTIPDDILLPYASLDAQGTRALADALRAQLEQYTGIAQLYWMVHEVNAPILDMEEIGIQIDRSRLAELTDLFQAKLTDMLADLQREAGWEERKETKLGEDSDGNPIVLSEVTLPGFNPDSPHDVRELLFGWFKDDKGEYRRNAPPTARVLNLEPVKSTDKTVWADVVMRGKQDEYKPSTDSESLGILQTESAFVNQLRCYKFVRQITKNFLQPAKVNKDGSVSVGGLARFIDDAGRAHTSYRLTLETGRYATSPNFQNLPKRRERELTEIFTHNGKLHENYRSIRSCFTARPGRVLVEADWNQAELWTLGAVSGDTEFLRILAESDIHTETMQAMFKSMDYKGKKIAEYTAKELNKLRKNDKSLDALRVSAKSVVFGIPYKRGPAAIAREVKREGIEVPDEVAADWIRAFKSKFAVTAAFLLACENAVDDPGYIENPYNRRRSFTKTDDRSVMAAMKREAVNFPIQSTVGDTMTRALINFYYYKQAFPEVDFDVILSVHDAVVLDVHPAWLEKVCDEVIPLCMVNAAEVPKIGLKYSLGDLDISTRWGEHDDPQVLRDLKVPDRFIKEKKKAA